MNVSNARTQDNKKERTNGLHQRPPYVEVTQSHLDCNQGVLFWGVPSFETICFSKILLNFNPGNINIETR